MKKSLVGVAFAGVTLLGGVAFAQSGELSVKGSDQNVSGGTVVTSEVMAGENGWLVIHRTDGSKPGPVIGHAPLRKGKNTDVAAILTEPVKKGEKLMLMLHSEAGGMKTGIFEYYLGAKEDGPVRVNGNLVMTVITAQ